MSLPTGRTFTIKSTSLKPTTAGLIRRAHRNKGMLTPRGRKSVAKVYKKARKALGASAMRANLSKNMGC